MKHYESYKDSGIEWFGKIPSHWRILKIKNFFNIISGATPDSNTEKYWDGDIIWITPADYKSADHYVSKGKRNITFEGYNSCGTTLVPAGSIIFSKRAPIGTVAISRNELCTNQGCLSCIPKENVSSSYYYYLFSVLTDAFETLGYGSTFLEISAFNFANFSITAPSFDEQQVIASYLDNKVDQIDSIIAEKKVMVEDLQNYCKSIITETVTRGMNPDVPMKNSGIDWMGAIPEHWKIAKTSYLFEEIGSGTTPNTNNEKYYVEDGINWLQTGDLNDGYIDKTTKHISLKALEENTALRIYPKGSLVIAMYGATIGKVGILNIETTTNQACCVLANSQNLLRKYAYYAFIASKQSLVNLAFGGGQPNISQAIIRNHKLPVPPLEEQQAIITHLDSKMQGLDFSISELQLQIEDLKSYKSSLITEAVTGKIDLR